MNNGSTFQDELEALINKWSKENGSDTPDFLLAEYLVRQLEVFNNITKRRTDWHDGIPTPSEEQ